MSGDDRQNSPSISRQNRPSATLNVQEVSNFLGLGLSQVYELVKRIDFPAFKVGSRIFVPKDKFLTWLNVQTEEKDSLFYTE